MADGDFYRPEQAQQQGGDFYRPRSRSPRRRSRTRSPGRGRSRTPQRGYSRSRSRDNRRRSPDERMDDYNDGGDYGAPQRDEQPRGGRDEFVNDVKANSQQERRVYVGNLAYEVKWDNLKDYMRQAGEVKFAEVLTLPNGMSKGCGIVEYATPEEAQQAIQTLSNKEFMGRLVFIREDREVEPRFGAASQAPRGGFAAGAAAGGGAPPMGGRQLYVSGIPFTAGWQDLKDMFRSAGNVIRADVHTSFDGRPKGSGVVLFETAADAQNAMQMFNGYDWQGRALDVRVDRFAGAPQRGGFQGGPMGRGGFMGGPMAGRGGFMGGPMGGPMGGRGGFMGGRGGFRGGFGGGYGGGFGGRGGFAGGYGGSGYGGGFGGGHGGAPGHSAPAATQPPNEFTDGATGGGEPSTTIFVRNLPWSTSNDDLVELFTTIGKVERAEIQYEPSGRSKGTGVVQFDHQDSAGLAITKFTGYQYGGRPLGLSYVRYVPVGGPAQQMGGNMGGVMENGNGMNAPPMDMGGDIAMAQDQQMM
ncbi:g-strand binding protein [Saitoella coloradoensis]